MKECARGVLASVLVLLGVALPGSRAHAQAPDLPPELAKVRAAMEKYRDPVVAVRDGYFSTLGCVAYPDGGMGIHFLNPQLVGPVPDPLKPAILLYEPVGDKLELVGVEWFIPLATGIKERPQIFGRPFDGPMEGHEPLLPKELHHYDLHVWIFKPNPRGLFAVTNPTVKCPAGAPYTFALQPAKPVPHPKP
jgi:hypothetical protein